MQRCQTALDCARSDGRGFETGEDRKLRMKLLIIGAAGMIGRKLTARLARDGHLAGKIIDHAHLVDIVTPAALDEAPFPVALEAFDIAAPYVGPKLVAPRPDIIFLLAS